MTSKSLLAPALALGATVLAGCAAAKPGDSLAHVQEAVAMRGELRVHWNRGSAADQQAAISVRQLLAEPLSADAAVQVALLNNPTLQATYEDVGVAQAELVDAGLLRNPVFDAEVRFPEGGGSTGLDLAVVADFLNVFQIPLRKRLARSALEAAELRTADAVLGLAADVRQAYAQAVAAQQLLELRGTHAEAAAAAMEVAQRLHDAGNITDLALVSEQASAESAQLEMAEAEFEAQSARLRLGQLLGVVGDGWQLPPQLAEPVAEQFATGELEAIALRQRLDLRAADLGIRSAQQALAGARRFGGMDEIEAGGGGERDDGDWSFGPNLAIPLPLFNQGQGRIAAARAELRRNRAQRAATELAIRAEVRTAAAQLAAAQRRAVRLREVLLPLHERIVEESVLQYNAMDLGIFDLLRAKQEQIAAQTEHVAALRDYWSTRAALERAAGGQLPRGTPATLPVTTPATAAAAPPTTAPAPSEAHQHHHHH